MSKPTKKSGLGRGLSSLIGESHEEATPAAAHNIAGTSSKQQAASVLPTPAPTSTNSPEKAAQDAVRASITGRSNAAPGATDEVLLNSITPNPDQPRTYFKPDEIEELAASIKKDGLLQPILVRRVGDRYQIVAGERRWQACKSLGLEKVAVRVIDANDEKAIELALIENIQRSDLNPIEEAYGYKTLIDRRGMTQSDVAEAVSKGRSTIANALRLLELPEQAQQLLFEDRITAGHARAILSIPTEDGRLKLTERLAAEKLSVREAEDIARQMTAGSTPKKDSPKREQAPESFKRVASGLRDVLQTNVRIKSARGKNSIEIEFKDENDLKRLFEHIAGA